MSAKVAEGSDYSISFSGICKHCGNATLMHIIELNIQSCAFCHQTDSASFEVVKKRQVQSGLEVIMGTSNAG